MNPSEFDKFAEEYRSLLEENIAISGETPEYFADYKVKDLQRVLTDASGCAPGGRFLDFGGGIGSSVPSFRKYFPDAHLTCVDVSLKSIEIGSMRFGTSVGFVAFDGKHLPFAHAAFDCAFAACVFHHVPPAEHVGLCRELLRVLKPQGHIMLYEHNPHNPLTVRTVSACSFDKNAILIGAGTLKTRLESAGFTQCRIKYRVFFPRRLSWLRSRMENKLGWLPLGAQYYVCGRK